MFTFIYYLGLDDISSIQLQGLHKSYMLLTVILVTVLMVGLQFQGKIRNTSAKEHELPSFCVLMWLKT